MKLSSEISKQSNCQANSQPKGLIYANKRPKINANKALGEFIKRTNYSSNLLMRIIISGIRTKQPNLFTKAMMQ